MGSKSSTIDRLSSAFNFFVSSALQILTFPSACRTMETVVFVRSPFFFFPISIVMEICNKKGNWNLVCVDKKEGGLGICTFVALNKALL